MDSIHTDVRVQKVNLIICQRLSESLKRSVFVIISRILRIHFTKKNFIIQITITCLRNIVEEILPFDDQNIRPQWNSLRPITERI